MSFEENFKRSQYHFLSYLENLGNPFTLEEIKSTLKNINQNDVVTGFKSKFETVIISKELNKILEEFSDSSQKYFESSQNKEEALDIIIEELKHIGNKIFNSIEPWEDLITFFKLPGIRKLKNDDLNIIIMIIKKEDVDELRDTLKQVIPKKERLKIDQELEAIQSDLDSLAADLINEMPKSDENFNEYFKKSKDYFINKIIIYDLNENESFNGLIVNCEKESNTLIFHTNNQFSIRIRKTQFEVKLTRLVKRNFLSFLLELETDEEFKIEFSQPNMPDFNKIFMNGNYKVISKHQKENFKLKFWTTPGKINIISLEFRDKTYKISFHENPEFKAARVVLKVGSEKMEHETEKEFLNKHFFILKSIKSKKIFKNAKELKKFLKINENVDKRCESLVHAKRIQEKIDQIRNDLITEENKITLELFTNNLISNRLESINLVLFKQNKKIYDNIIEICEESKIYLAKEINPIDLLKNLVINCNYAAVVTKEQSIEIAKTMDLLKDAYVHLDKLEYKKLIMFIGNTGSGKSTTISYLLGARLNSYINKVGEKVFEIKNNKDTQIEYPRIGQSLGESETIYTQGYPIRDSEDFYFVDCPGFNDTRGCHYELCTNISIDQAIKRSDSIHALVLVIPIQIFLIDRGNLVYDLAISLRERFPNLFTEDPSSNSSFFIIITKANQVNFQVKNSIKDGSRFNELYFECEKKINNLKDQDNPDNLMIESMNKRLMIWNTFRKLHSMKHIDLIDLLCRKDQQKYLKKYIKSSTPLDKKFYIRLMNDPDMNLKFLKCIEMSVHTWKLLIEKYLRKIPNKQMEKQIIIEEIEFTIVEKVNERDDNIKRLEQEIDTLKNAMYNLVNSLENSDNLMNEETKILVNEQIFIINNNELVSLTNEIILIENKIITNRKKYDDIKIKLEILQGNLDLLNNITECLKNEIENLKIGHTDEILAENNPDPDDELTVQIIRKGELFKKLSKENRDFTEDEMKSAKIMKYKDFRGKLIESVTIEKKYSLFRKIIN